MEYPISCNPKIKKLNKQTTIKTKQNKNVKLQQL